MRPEDVARHYEEIGEKMKEKHNKFVNLMDKPATMQEKRGHYLLHVFVDRGYNLRKTQAEACGVASSTLSDILNGAKIDISESTRQKLMDCLGISQLEWDTMSYVPQNPYATQRKLGLQGSGNDTMVTEFMGQPMHEDDQRRSMWLVCKAIQAGQLYLDELASYMQVPVDRLFDVLAGDAGDDLLWFDLACKLAFGECYVAV